MVLFNIFDTSFNTILHTVLKKRKNCKILKYSFGIFYFAKNVLKYLNSNEEVNYFTIINFNDKLINELKYIYYNIIDLDYKDENESINDNNKILLNNFDRKYSYIIKVNKLINYRVKVKKNVCEINNNFINTSINLTKQYNEGDKYFLLKYNNLNMYRNKFINTNYDFIKYFNGYKNIGTGTIHIDFQKILNEIIKYFYSYCLSIFELFDINVNKRLLNKNQEVIYCIIKVFRNKNYKLQYKVKEYILELYFVDYKLVIEYNYNNESKEKYLKREKEIQTNLNCTFMRYNPNLKDFDIFKLIGTINIFMNRFDKL